MQLYGNSIDNADILEENIHSALLIYGAQNFDKCSQNFLSYRKQVGAFNSMFYPLTFCELHIIFRIMIIMIMAKSLSRQTAKISLFTNTHGA